MRVRYCRTLIRFRIVDMSEHPTTHNLLEVSRNIYAITAEPRGRVYENLLAEGLRHCDQFLFVDVPEPRFGPDDTSFRAGSRDLVRELEPHLLRIDKSKSW